MLLLWIKFDTNSCSSVLKIIHTTPSTSDIVRVYTLNLCISVHAAQMRWAVCLNCTQSNHLHYLSMFQVKNKTCLTSALTVAQFFLCRNVSQYQSEIFTKEVEIPKIHQKMWRAENVGENFFSFYVIVIHLYNLPWNNCAAKVSKRGEFQAK